MPSTTHSGSGTTQSPNAFQRGWGIGRGLLGGAGNLVAHPFREIARHTDQAVNRVMGEREYTSEGKTRSGIEGHSQIGDPQNHRHLGLAAGHVGGAVVNAANALPVTRLAGTAVGLPFRGWGRFKHTAGSFFRGGRPAQALTPARSIPAPEHALRSWGRRVADNTRRFTGLNFLRGEGGRLPTRMLRGTVNRASSPLTRSIYTHGVAPGSEEQRYYDDHRHADILYTMFRDERFLHRRPTDLQRHLRHAGRSALYGLGAAGRFVLGAPFSAIAVQDDLGRNASLFNDAERQAINGYFHLSGVPGPPQYPEWEQRGGWLDAAVRNLTERGNR